MADYRLLISYGKIPAIWRLVARSFESAIFGIAFHNSSRVFRECSIARFPSAVI